MTKLTVSLVESSLGEKLASRCPTCLAAIEDADALNIVGAFIIKQIDNPKFVNEIYQGSFECPHGSSIVVTVIFGNVQSN